MSVVVAIVGFVLMVGAGPLVGAYAATWFTTGDHVVALSAVLGGGAAAPLAIAVVAALVGSIAFAITVKLTAGSLLDRLMAEEDFGLTDTLVYLGGSPAVRAYHAYRDAERAQEEAYSDPATLRTSGFAAALGWVGVLFASIVLFGLWLVGWPGAPPNAIARVAVGGATLVDWAAAVLPALARTTIAAIAAVFVGALWSLTSRENP